MPTIRSLMVRLGFSSDLSGLNRAGKGIDNLNRAVLGLGAALAGVGLALKQTIDIERSVGKAMSIVGKSGKEFHSMKNQMMKDAMDMSENLGFAAKDIGEGFYQVISAGIDPTSSKFKSLANLGFKLAKLGDMAPADAIEKLNDTLNAFALKGDQYSRVADVVFKASNLSAVTIPQLVESMRDAGPAAYQAGLSIEETSAIIATMAERGIKGAEAGVAFRMIMNRIASGPGKEALKKMGISAFNANGEMLPFVETLRKIQAAQAKMTSEQKQANTVAIAGRYAYSKLGGLLSKDMDVVENWTKQLESAGGSMHSAFILYSALSGESLTKLKQSIINLIATMGTPFLMPLANTADYLRELSFGARKAIEEGTPFGKMLQALTKIIGGGMGFLTMIAGTALALNLLGKSFKIGKALYLSPYGKAIMALIVPLLLLIEVIDTLRGKTTWLSDWMTETTDAAYRKYAEATGTPIMKKPGEDFARYQRAKSKDIGYMTEGVTLNPATWGKVVKRMLETNRALMDATYFNELQAEKTARGKYSENTGPRMGSDVTIHNNLEFVFSGAGTMADVARSNMKTIGNLFKVQMETSTREALTQASGGVIK